MESPKENTCPGASPETLGDSHPVEQPKDSSVKSRKKSFLKYLQKSSGESQSLSPSKNTKVTSPKKGKSLAKTSDDSQALSPTEDRKPLSPKKLLSEFRNFFSPKRSNVSSSISSARPVLSSQCSGEPDGVSAMKIEKDVVNLKYEVYSFYIKGERFDSGNIDDDKIIPNFLSLRTCYEAMPKSGKVVVLSKDLLVKNAFSSLVTNEIRAAPLWDSSRGTFVGMLTISDFISVLRYYYNNSGDDIEDIENQTISTLKGLPKNERFVSTTPNDHLANATKLLIKERVHRLPVCDEKRKSVLFVMSRKRLLNYLYNNLIDKFKTGYVRAPVFWNQSIAELKSRIGTWENIATVSVNDKVIDALDLLCERQVSSLPVMDEDGRLKDIIAKFDVFALAKEQMLENLDMTVQQALDKAEMHHESVCICELNNPLGTVIDKFVTAKVHRLLFLDENEAVIGILSLSDILRFLVLQPLGDSAIPTAVIDETPEGAVGGPDDSSAFLDCGQGPSGNLQNPSSLDKQDSSDLSEDVAKLQLEAGTPEPLSEA